MRIFRLCPRRCLSAMVTTSNISRCYFFSWECVFGLPLHIYKYCRQYGLQNIKPCSSFLLSCFSESSISPDVRRILLVYSWLPRINEDKTVFPFFLKFRMMEKFSPSANIISQNDFRHFSCI